MVIAGTESLRQPEASRSPASRFRSFGFIVVRHSSAPRRVCSCGWQVRLRVLWRSGAAPAILQPQQPRRLPSLCLFSFSCIIQATPTTHSFTISQNNGLGTCPWRATPAAPVFSAWPVSCVESISLLTISPPPRSFYLLVSGPFARTQLHEDAKLMMPALDFGQPTGTFRGLPGKMDGHNKYCCPAINTHKTQSQVSSSRVSNPTGRFVPHGSKGRIVPPRYQSWQRAGRLFPGPGAPLTLTSPSLAVHANRRNRS